MRSFHINTWEKIMSIRIRFHLYHPYSVNFLGEISALTGKRIIQKSLNLHVTDQRNNLH